MLDIIIGYPTKDGYPPPGYPPQGYPPQYAPPQYAQQPPPPSKQHVGCLEGWYALSHLFFFNILLFLFRELVVCYCFK